MPLPAGMRPLRRKGSVTFALVAILTTDREQRQPSMRSSELAHTIPNRVERE
jgi:hypothetical protein